MKGPQISILKKYLTAIGKIKAKYITCERLSRVVGVYPEIIAENLSYFEPMITIDQSVNLLEIVPDIKKYIEDHEEKKPGLSHKDLATKKDINDYESVNDFIYKKMTFAGMIDKNVKLSDKDLRVLKRLISEELLSRKKK